MRRLLAPLFFIAVLAVIWFGYLRPDPGPTLQDLKPEPATRMETVTLEASQTMPDTPLPLSPTPTPTPRDQTPPPPTALTLEAELDSVTARDTVTAYLGVATIDPEDLAEFETAIREGGAVPEDLHDLANVVSRQTVPVMGRGVIGPVTVPPAPRYRLLAFTPEGKTWQGQVDLPDWEDTVGRLHIGPLPLASPTGLLLQVVGKDQDSLQGWTLRLERHPDPDLVADHAYLNQIHQLMDNQVVFEAYRRPIAFTNNLRLAPLFPDPAVTIHLRPPTGHIFSERIDLQPGMVQYKSWKMETIGNVGEHPPPLTVEGRMLLPGGEPVAGGMVRRVGRRHNKTPIGPDGRFTLTDVPREALRFSVDLTLPESERPFAAKTQIFAFDGRQVTADLQEVDVAWTVRPYRWLLLESGSQERQRLSKQTRKPFPIYILQAQEAEGPKEIGADVFHDQANGMAVSLTRDGTYRVVTALSPFWVATGPWLHSDATNTEVAAPLKLGLPPEDLTLHCQDRLGQPLSEVPVIVLGDHSGVPPLRTHTDVHGLVRLGPVNARQLHVSLMGRDYLLQTNQGTGKQLLLVHRE